jgi:hypothetical protein
MPADRRVDDSEAEEGAEEADREVTPVGRVSKNLLELSSANEQNQNTRAYQAPAELLELARRQRERAQAKAAGKPTESKAPPVSPELEAEAAPPRPIGESLAPRQSLPARTSLPAGASLPARDRPTRRPGRKSEEGAESSAPSISVEPASSSDSMNFGADSEQSESSGEDAAPPVARSRPSRALSEEAPPASAPRPPKSLRELMRSTSDPEAPRSLAAPSEVSYGPADSEPRSSESATSSGPRTSYLVTLVLLFIALGFALAKWQALEALLRR